MDPNILACNQHPDLLKQLIESGAKVDFNQGIDARLLTPKNISLLKEVNIKEIHFAWDDPKDEEIIIPKLKLFKTETDIREREAIVYVLVNFNSTFEEDLHRVYTIRDLGMTPYIMIFDKDKTKSTDPVRRLQSWVNNKRIWFKNQNMKFEEFDRRIRSDNR